MKYIHVHACIHVLQLVASSNSVSYIVFQEHTPMTEDMLMEQATVLSNLGTSEEAARVRAKMQSSSLLSDMQAFKVHSMTSSTCTLLCIYICTCKIGEMHNNYY